MSENSQETKCKILKGIEKAFLKLLDEKKKEDGDLVFSDKNGNIVRVKASDFELRN